MGTFGGTRRQRTALGVVLLAVLGAWLGHGVEALRLEGVTGLSSALTGPVHLYMLPVGAVLVLVAALLGIQCWRLWLELGRRLSQARAQLRRAWRGGTGERPPAAPERRALAAASGGLGGWLCPLLAVAQIGLYVLQENLETVVSGGHAPGMAVLDGVHRPVVLVQLGVAVLLAGIVALVRRRLDRRSRQALRCERLARALLVLTGRRQPMRRGGLLWLRPPYERLGAQLWSRPPPLVTV
jgi:Flp pilus assembly protein TadB